MKRFVYLFTSVTSVLIFAGNAYADVSVPEVDGGSAILSLGLIAGLVAVIRERRHPK